MPLQQMKGETWWFWEGGWAEGSCESRQCSEATAHAPPPGWMRVLHRPPPSPLKCPLPSLPVLPFGLKSVLEYHHMLSQCPT